MQFYFIFYSRFCLLSFSKQNLRLGLLENRFKIKITFTSLFSYSDHYFWGLNAYKKKRLVDGECQLEK